MIHSTQIALLELLKATLFHCDPQLPDELDWDAVLQEAKDHAVVALAAPSVPQEEARKWLPLVDQNTAHTMQLLFVQRELTQLLGANSIPFAVLKGTAAAVYYPNPVQRTMGDIDLIVPPDRFDEAKRLLEENGYVTQYGDVEDGRHIGFDRHGVALELHRRFSTFSLDVEPVIESGLQHTQQATVLGSTFPMLPEQENGIVLLAHMRQHLLEDEYCLGLRQVIDWMMYVHANSQNAAWQDGFMALARRFKLDKLAATITSVCKVWLGLPDELSWEADRETVDALFERILSGGNFSRKRSNEEIVNDPVHVTLEGVRQEGVFRYLQEGGMINWKAAQRHRFLRPFAWLYQVFRYVGLIFARLFGGKPLLREISEGKKELDFKNRIGV